jgi:BirA family transcriptional regulator, biotin operon repressor / biotin---[acetyl-CoA-carboxylase] ligase
VTTEDFDGDGSDGWSDTGWREVRVVERTGSTNADLAAAADAGEPHGLVLLARRQDAGRGRLDRQWVAPAGSGLTVSVLLRPPVPAARLGWLPLLTGLAAVEGVTEAAHVAARLKWPNDVLVGDRKLGGVLAEVRPSRTAGVPDAVIVGLGLNATLREDQLPVPTATSLLLVGASTTDVDVVLRAFLAALAGRYRAWVEADGDADACGLRAAYTVRCATVGRAVRVELPGGALTGEAVGIDAHGQLRVSDPSDGTVHEVAAGDVVHVR